MREIYEQFIAYSRDYANRTATYTPGADHLARVSIGISSALNAVCGAITYGAAGARSPLVARAAPTPGPQLAGKSRNPEFFLTEQCRMLTMARSSEAFTDDTASGEWWTRISPATGVKPVAARNQCGRFSDNARVRR